MALAGCTTEVERVEYNLTQEADNFNVVRQLTVINCIQGDVLFQMTGKMSITADMEDNQRDYRRRWWYICEAFHRIK